MAARAAEAGSTMNPTNAWLLLSARAPTFGSPPGGFGAVTPADVALSLQGLPREKFLLGMAVLAGDATHLRELWTHAHIWVVDTAERFDWECKRGSEAWRALAAL